jgi:hypothetical protein
LTDALAAALTAKDLETANELDSAVKLLAMDKPFVAPRFQQAIDAERTYDDTLRTAVEEHQTALSAAENSCRQELQEALDAALAAKNLGQANNINAAIREIERRIALRNAAPPKTFVHVHKLRRHKIRLAPNRRVPDGQSNFGLPADTRRGPASGPADPTNRHGRP